MNKLAPTITLALLLMVPAAPAAAQTCSPSDQQALNSCLDQCASSCQASVPACQKQPISLDDLKAAIAQKCDCSTAKNYGQYHSCVMRLINSLRAFSLIDHTSLMAVMMDDKTCKTQMHSGGNGHMGNRSSHMGSNNENMGSGGSGSGTNGHMGNDNSHRGGSGGMMGN